MHDFDLQPTSTAHWYKLVCDAEHRAHRHLGEEVQSYLVFLLQRFLGKSEIAGQVLALDYLKSFYSTGRQQIDRLRDVGDSCLLHAGFFPMRARRRLVNTSYYVDLGIGAYYQLHHNTSHQQGQLYERLYESFVPAMDVLQSMRSNQQSEPLLDPIAAHELWEHTGSTQARERLRAASDGEPVITVGRGQSSHKH